jgi:hypothetical protein
MKLPLPVLHLAPVLLLLAACSSGTASVAPQTLASATPEVSEIQVPEVPWYPRGFFKMTDEVAGKWIKGAKDPCGSGARCWYWTLDVTSKDGCLDGVYVNVNFLDKGTVVDDSIDSVSSLRAGQKARFQFWTYDRSVDEIEPTSVSCY